jgi:predicted transcriptional regulator
VGLEQVIMGRIVCGDPEGHRVKFRLSELNRATDAQRAQLNATYVQNGIKTRNEVRREEGLRDAEGGDVLTAQTNLAPIDQLNLDNFPRETTPQTVIDDTKPQKQ